MLYWYRKTVPCVKDLIIEDKVIQKMTPTERMTENFLN